MESIPSKIKIISYLILIFYVLSGPLLLYSQSKATDTLFQEFNSPPDIAKPRVWWHWMNGNVTKEGITKDLEWMKRVGIGGMQMFEASLGTPRIVKNPIIFNTPEWKDAIKHTGQEASRLGLEWTLSASGGWSQTGGPMVKQEAAMKKIVWTETVIEGGQNYSGILPIPPSMESTFLDAPKGGFNIDPNKFGPAYYKDFSVIAYKIPDLEVNNPSTKPTISSSSPIDYQLLSDGKLNKSVSLKVTEGTETAYIEYKYPVPIKTYAITMAIGAVSSGFIPAQATGQVLASVDGKEYFSLITFPGATHRPSVSRTYTFKETIAQFYRIEFKPIIKSSYDITAGIGDMLGGPPLHPKVYNLSEIEIHNAPRVNQWQDKAAYGLMFEYQTVPTPYTSQAIEMKEVVDLTHLMKADGQIEWQAPPGKWSLIRMGYSLTGQMNGPAPAELTGYEVDKLNSKYVTQYIDEYLKPYTDAIGDLNASKSLKYLLLDSWEANLQNWSDQFLDDFKTRNGYDAKPYLPILIGRIIGSAEISDRFLWDYRNTISDLIAENHFNTITNHLHKKGIKTYGEAPGNALGTMAEGLKSKGRVDIPMGEFWTVDKSKFRAEHQADILEAASAAHIYNKTIVAAESFTDVSRPFGPPSYLKNLADYYMTLGVNRFVFHTSVHQPLDDMKPGFTLAIFGQHYTRHNTWAEQSKAWNLYLTRCSYLLQQGKSNNDIAFFAGEDAPAVASFWEKQSPEIPEGYKIDLVNAEIILNKMTVKNGDLILPDGVRYKLLVIADKTNKLSLPLLSKIKELVAAGATISGPKTISSTGLTNYPQSDIEVNKISEELWGATNGGSVSIHKYKSGMVFWGKPIKEVMHYLETKEDFLYTKNNFDTKINFIHRKLNSTDIYFIANQGSQTENCKLSFRIMDKIPELWHPDKGTAEKISYKIENGQTIIPYDFEPFGSVFIVFREQATKKEISLPKPKFTLLQNLTGSWQIKFPPLFNNNSLLKIDSLVSWTMIKDSSINYFSGTANYKKTFIFNSNPANQKIILQLGEVREIAEIKLNGINLGILWKAPFEIDISKAIKSGNNLLEIDITNLWTNRMEGDKRLPANKQYTFATNSIFGNNFSSPIINLIPSGLIGPVKIFSVK